jgi:F0F1-type ATP synthase membrane subunit b/b'
MLRAEAAELALELAGRLLREELTADDRERLVAEFVERIERAQAPGAGG